MLDSLPFKIDVFSRHFTRNCLKFDGFSFISIKKQYIVENIQVGAGHLRIFTNIFSSICGTFFLGIPDRQLNLGYMCFSVQMSSIKMLNVDEVRAYLSSLNTMDVIWLGNRLGD